MVRLSLIILGLLAAVWCFSGTTEGVRVRGHQDRRHTHLICGYGQKIKVEKCYKITSSCPKVTYSSGSVKCISKDSAEIMKKKCNKKHCQTNLKKGPYTCKYSCVKATRICKPSRSIRGYTHCYWV